MKRGPKLLTIFSRVLLLAGSLLFIYLVKKIGVHRVWHELAALGWGVVPFVLCEGLAEFIHTFGWRCCLSEPYRKLSMPLLFRIRLAGYGLNYLTPTASLGGEAAKAALLANYHRSPQAVSGVLIEKVCFGLAHVLFVAVTAFILFPRVRLPAALWTSMIVSGAFVTAGVGGFFFLQKTGNLGGVIRWLSRKAPHRARIAQAARGITSVDEALRQFYAERPNAVWQAVAWHLAGYSIGILQTWLFVSLLTGRSSPGLAATFWCVGMWFDLLTFAVPLNAGTLEGSRTLIFQLVGLGSVLGLTYGVALRFTQLFWAGMGMLFYGAMSLPPERKRSRKARAEPNGANSHKPSLFLRGLSRRDTSNLHSSCSQPGKAP